MNNANEYEGWVGKDATRKRVTDTMVLVEYKFGDPELMQVPVPMWGKLASYLPVPSQLAKLEYFVDRYCATDPAIGDYFAMKLYPSPPWDPVTALKIEGLRFRKDSVVFNGTTYETLLSTKKMQLPGTDDGWRVDGYMRLIKVPLGDDKFKFCALLDMTHEAFPGLSFNAAWCWPN
jgi:hypothetical protein